MGGENRKYIEAEIPVYQQLTFLPKEIRNFFTKKSAIAPQLWKSAILQQRWKLTTFHNIKIQHFFRIVSQTILFLHNIYKILHFAKKNISKSTI